MMVYRYGAGILFDDGPQPPKHEANALDEVVETQDSFRLSHLMTKFNLSRIVRLKETYTYKSFIQMNESIILNLNINE